MQKTACSNDYLITDTFLEQVEEIRPYPKALQQ